MVAEAEAEVEVKVDVVVVVKLEVEVDELDVCLFLADRAQGRTSAGEAPPCILLVTTLMSRISWFWPGHTRSSSRLGETDNNVEEGTLLLWAEGLHSKPHRLSTANNANIPLKTSTTIINQGVCDRSSSAHLTLFDADVDERRRRDVL